MYLAQLGLEIEKSSLSLEESVLRDVDRVINSVRPAWDDMALRAAGKQGYRGGIPIGLSLAALTCRQFLGLGGVTDGRLAAWTGICGKRFALLEKQLADSDASPELLEKYSQQESLIDEVVMVIRLLAEDQARGSQWGGGEAAASTVLQLAMTCCGERARHLLVGNRLSVWRDSLGAVLAEVGLSVVEPSMSAYPQVWDRVLDAALEPSHVSRFTAAFGDFETMASQVLAMEPVRGFSPAGWPLLMSAAHVVANCDPTTRTLSVARDLTYGDYSFCPSPEFEWCPALLVALRATVRKILKGLAGSLPVTLARGTQLGNYNIQDIRAIASRGCDVLDLVYEECTPSAGSAGAMKFAKPLWQALPDQSSAIVAFRVGPGRR